MPFGLLMMVACVVKQEEPDLLVPPSGYDVSAVTESSGFQLCIESTPEDARVQVSSREIKGCTEVKGEVFVEVSAEKHIPYRETLVVEGDLNHKVMLLPQLEPSQQIEYPMPTKEGLPSSFVAPGQPIELCVNVVPADASLQINGVKRPVGSCTQVQNAAEVRIEADGYEVYKELVSIPPNQKEAKTMNVVLVPSVVQQPL